MSRFIGSTAFTHDMQDRTGILVTNLGSPDAPTKGALRRYLAEFLSDPRVIEVPRMLWLPILHGIILRLRPARSARLYARIWTDGGSPLRATTEGLASEIEKSLSDQLPGPIKVAIGMRYGNPSIGAALETLRLAGCRRLLVLPLYPQYSATTTASTIDAITDQLRKWRWIPELRLITHYHDWPDYVSALANSIRSSIEENGAPDRLLFSFHGLPQRYLDEGDPYFCECHKTARLAAEHAGLPPDKWQVSFQSRVGRAEWLKPYTDQTLRELAQSGVKHLQVICPGFAADCLETLEEIAISGQETFLESGGESFHYIPALNTTTDHVQALTGLIRTKAQDWPGFDEAASQTAKADNLATPGRARALGASR